MTIEATDWPTDAFRRLRANLVAAASDAQASSILVTSIDSGDGGDAVVTNLAAALAAAGYLVVVVLARHDAGLETRLQLNGGPGFIDALAERARIQDTLRSIGFDNLRFCGRGTEGASAHTAIPGSRLSNEPPIPTTPVARYSDLLGSDRPKQVIRELTATADYVLIDAPPVQIDTDAYLLAGACDGVLAVATLATATRGDVEQAADQLSRVGARLLGTVLIDPEQPEEIPGRWSDRVRRINRNTNRKARVQPASNGVLNEALEA